MASSDWQKEAIRCQTEWSQILHSWKYFDSEDDLVKTYLGICLFGFVENETIENSSLRTYHLNYTESQRSHIKKIFTHLVSLSGHKIELGHTFLYLNESGIVYCIFRFRSKNKIFFIEPSGRCYNSWGHFLDTNELPACKFFAPENGVYHKSSKIVCYQIAGSKKWFKKSQTIMDWVCAVAGVGCTLLGVFSIAPGVAAGAAIAVGAKTLHKTVSNFLDQEEHRQLNTLGTVNGAISLASVAASACAGASKTYEMISLAGEHGLLSLKILQSLNFTGRLIDAGYFGTYLLHLSYISQKGKISSVDALELAAQIFILYGAVLNIDHLRNVINREEKMYLTKNDLCGKFNEWKYKLNKSGVRVQDCCPLIGLKLLASRCKNPLQILLKFYSKDELILNTCYDCEHFTVDFLCDKITLNQFCLEMRSLFEKFCHFFRDYNEEFGDIVRYHVTSILHDAVSENDYKDICKLITYAVTIIKKTEPESYVRFTEKIIKNDPAVSESETTENYKLIIDLAKHLVTKKNVYVSIDQVIKSCQDSIQFTTSKLKEIITETYNSIVDFNRGVVGEERLPVILKRVNASSLDEFFHHREAFRNFVDKFKTANESLPGHEFVPMSLSRLPDYEIQEITGKMMRLYESAYASQTNSKKLSLQDTMNTLQNVAAHWNEKLISIMKTPCNSVVSTSNLYSELNAKLAQITLDESVCLDRFRKVIKGLESEAQSAISSFPLLDDFVVITNDEKIDRSDSQLCEALVVVSCNFYTKLAATILEHTDNDDEHCRGIRLLRKVFHFVISKVLEMVQDEEISNKMLQNRDINESKSIFSLYPKSRFYSVIQNFDNTSEHSNELMKEFPSWTYDDTWSYNKIDIWQGIIDSDKFRLRIINCKKEDSEEFYKTISSKLFDIEVDHEIHEYDVTINVNSVFLKSLKKFIIFSYINDSDVFVTMLNLKLNI